MKMKVKMEIKKEMISCDVERTDHRKLLKDEGLTDSLVQFDPESELVTVDERATKKYAKYAAIHECICCGKKAHLVPSLGEGDFDRCARVDRLIMEHMPESYRKEYSRKRVEMFETLLKKGLNPTLNNSFEHSLDFHRRFLERR